MLTLVLGVLGIGMLFAGGELAVRGSVSLARRLSLPPLLIGVVIVGFITSMPELFVSVQAVARGDMAVAVGNVVGSDIVNLLLVLGVATLISPIAARAVSARRDAIALGVALFAATVLAALGGIGPVPGLLMVAGLAAYVAWSYRVDSHISTPEGRLHVADAACAECLPPAEPLWIVAGLLAGGLALLVLGASWVVSAAMVVARSAGLSEAAIALTVVSLGTTLPELAAAIASARHGHSELVIGNVIGSNFFNILAVLGVCAIVRPLQFDHLILLVDLPVLIVITVALMPVFFGKSGLRRWAGSLMVAAYAAYFVVRFLL